MPTLNRSIESDQTIRPAGPWSSAIEVALGARYVFTCGIVGIRPDGTFDPEIEGQTEQIYRNLTAILAAADMTLEHLVKVTTYLTDIAEQPRYAAARKPFWNDIRPAMALVEISKLARLGLKVEIEAVAAKAAS
jgi:2-iminobutanoate/2-iminopropanoate deaminase